MKRIIMICALSCMLLVNAASANLIIDTGEPPDVGSGWTLDSSQWLAGEFTLSQAYTVTDVVGWMFEGTPGNITVAIYGDGGDVPDAGSELYSQTLYVDIPDSMTNAWIGAGGVSWDLGPGTYWAAFEVHEAETHFAMSHDAPFPLDNYSFTVDNVWVIDVAGLDFGLRVSGEPVPVPGSLLLSSIGLCVVTRCLRRRRTA